MIGRRADPLESMARDVRWALDALHAKETWQAERILARAWETFVVYREGEESRLDERKKMV